MPSKNLRPVLLVEDSRHDIEFARRAFEKCGVEHPLAIAEDGELALALLNGRAAHRFGHGPLRPALVLLDLNLPGSGGCELLRQIKTDDELKQIPVAVLTTSTDPSDVNACYRLGANSYHHKPSDVRQYQATMRQITTYWLGTVIGPIAENEMFWGAVAATSG